MTLGFSSPERLRKLRDELLRWELYQVQIDKYHVMFWFEDEQCLLNVAYRFSYRSSDRSVEYVYDVQARGDRKFLNIDPILRRPIKVVDALDERQLALEFDTGDTLVVHDDPAMRSAWFYRYDPKDRRRVLWFVEDIDPEES
jgi:hypothetical protein